MTRRSSRFGRVRTILLGVVAATSLLGATLSPALARTSDVAAPRVAVVADLDFAALIEQLKAIIAQLEAALQNQQPDEPDANQAEEDVEDVAVEDVDNHDADEANDDADDADEDADEANDDADDADEDADEPNHDENDDNDDNDD